MTWGSKGWPCLPPPPLPLLLLVNCSPSALVFVFVSSHLCPWPCPPPTPLMLVVNCALYALHLFSVQTLRIKTMQWWSGSDMSSYVRRLEVNPSMRLVAKKKISLVSSGWPDGIWEWSLMSSWGEVQMRFEYDPKEVSALLASISKGIGWGTTSACCLIWNWLGSLTRMIPTKSKTWESVLSIGLLAAFKSSWSRWSLGLRLRHWPFVQFDSGLSCFVCVLIIYYSNEVGTSSVVYWLDLCTDLNVICLARYF